MNSLHLVYCISVVMQEVKTALECGCSMIPVLDTFEWPEPDALPEDMRAVCHFNGIRLVQITDLKEIKSFTNCEKNDLVCRKMRGALLDVIPKGSTIRCTVLVLRCS